MPIPLVAVGCVAMVKAGAVMGQYSMKNYDPNREYRALQVQVISMSNFLQSTDV
jgi:hypothetical protein